MTAIPVMYYKEANQYIPLGYVKNVSTGIHEPPPTPATFPPALLPISKSQSNSLVVTPEGELYVGMSDKHVESPVASLGPHPAFPTNFMGNGITMLTAPDKFVYITFQGTDGKTYRGKLPIYDPIEIQQGESAYTYAPPPPSGNGCSKDTLAAIGSDIWAKWNTWVRLPAQNGYPYYERDYWFLRNMFIDSGLLKYAYPDGTYNCHAFDGLQNPDGSINYSPPTV